MRIRTSPVLLATLFGLSFALSAAAGMDSIEPRAPRLGLPIDCQLGQDCFVLKYFDTGRGPDEVDSFCGRQTTDRHNGTDFALPSLAATSPGIAVLAVQSGTVLHTRDGSEDEVLIDRLMGNPAEQPAVLEGDGCGNGLVIDHGEGWTSLYCHLKKDSLAVVPGSEVRKGDVLGLVGASGEAGYPHVHLTVSYFGEAVDPFLGPNPGADCRSKRSPLWDGFVDSSRPPGLLSAGFSSSIPTRMEIWKGMHSESTMSTQDSLVMWVHAFGVEAGDRYHIKVTSPLGEEVVHVSREIEESAKDWLSFAGLGELSSRLDHGVWTGEFGLVRNGERILEVSSQVRLFDPEAGASDPARATGLPSP